MNFSNKNNDIEENNTKNSLLVCFISGMIIFGLLCFAIIKNS